MTSTHAPARFSTRLSTRVVAAALLALSGVAWAQGGASTLTPPEQRTSDAAQRTDQRSYESLQQRIQAINAAGRPLQDGHLAQAQCWLDTSFHEYTRNDRGPWPQEAMGQAEALIKALEARTAPPPLVTPLVTPLIAGAERIRPDLWQRSQALRQQPGWPCAQARAACAEVELVHAAHELAQMGWRHARPYVQIAEDLIGEAEAQSRQCRAGR